MRTCRRSYFLGGLFLLGTNACALLIPWLMKLAIEALQAPEKPGQGVATYSALIAAAAASQGIIRIFSRTTLLHAARRIEYHIRADLYDQLLRLDLTWFGRERTGDILSRFANDLTNVRMLIGFGVLNIINTLVVYSATLILMLRISPFLTLCSIIPFPLMILTVKRMSASMFRRSRVAQEELARLSSRVEENVAAASLIRAYCREESQAASFREVCDRYLASNMGMARIRGAMIPVMAATGATGTLIVLFVGGSRVISGLMTLGDFVAFSGYLAMLVWPTLIMGWLLNMMQRGAASMARINEILDARPGVTDSAEAVHPGSLAGKIEFRGLFFSYGNGPVLEDISLAIPAGSRVGIVGPVGSGKSTLARLVPRLFPVPDNSLFLDGIDINRLPLGSVRGAIGFVPQESFLFSRSIRDNIAYGRETADDGKIRSAAELASFATEVGRFPAGYDTLVGERGVTLSGGQKQRAAIARALLADPQILILDDPLSAVDARTEEEILHGLSSYYGGRTVLIVSHRLSAVRDCDRIVVLDNGKIAEQGTHDELVSRGGRYATMWREQQLRKEIEEF